MPGIGTRDAMKQFVSTYGLPFPQAVDEHGSLWTHFGIAYQPGWVFIDDSGESSVVPYELSRSELEEWLDALIRV